MASEEMGLFSAQRLDNGLSPHPQLVFPESFSCGPPPPPHPRRNSGPGAKTTRELTGFLNNHHYFRPMPQATAADFRRPTFAHRWIDRDSSTPSGDRSDEDGDDDGDEHGAERRVDLGNHDSIRKVNNNCCTDDSGNQKANDVPNFGSKEGNLSGSSVEEARNALAVAEANGGMYYMQGSGSNLCQRDILVGDKGCGYSGRRESSSHSSEIGESLRAILSDPISGALMDDAMILPCGHSFGSGGAQHVVRMKACYNCAQPVSEESIAPNLSLRAAVQAFRREEDLQVIHQSRSRKEKHDQDKGASSDSMLSDHPRGRGAHFPFAVADRVIIKGNKRTPMRFVGREAVVTSQCLNGWYVVKTLDNAESVKLQYRSLAKAAPDNSSPQPISCSKPSSSWL